MIDPRATTWLSGGEEYTIVTHHNGTETLEAHKLRHESIVAFFQLPGNLPVDP